MAKAKAARKPQQGSNKVAQLAEARAQRAQATQQAQAEAPEKESRAKGRARFRAARIIRNLSSLRVSAANRPLLDRASDAADALLRAVLGEKKPITWDVGAVARAMSRQAETAPWGYAKVPDAVVLELRDALRALADAHPKGRKPPPKDDPLTPGDVCVLANKAIEIYAGSISVSDRLTVRGLRGKPTAQLAELECGPLRFFVPARHLARIARAADAPKAHTTDVDALSLELASSDAAQEGSDL